MLQKDETSTWRVWQLKLGRSVCLWPSLSFRLSLGVWLRPVMWLSLYLVKVGIFNLFFLYLTQKVTSDYRTNTFTSCKQKNPTKAYLVFNIKVITPGLSQLKKKHLVWCVTSKLLRTMTSCLFRSVRSVTFLKISTVSFPLKFPLKKKDHDVKKC